MCECEEAPVLPARARDLLWMGPQRHPLKVYYVDQPVSIVPDPKKTACAGPPKFVRDTALNMAGAGSHKDTNQASA